MQSFGQREILEVIFRSVLIAFEEYVQVIVPLVSPTGFP